jgi:hypothetical protein
MAQMVEHLPSMHKFNPQYSGKKKKRERDRDRDRDQLQPSTKPYSSTAVLKLGWE